MNMMRTGKSFLLAILASGSHLHMLLSIFRFSFDWEAGCDRHWKRRMESSDVWKNFHCGVRGGWSLPSIVPANDGESSIVQQWWGRKSSSESENDFHPAVVSKVLTLPVKEKQGKERRRRLLMLLEGSWHARTCDRSPQYHQSAGVLIMLSSKGCMSFKTL